MKKRGINHVLTLLAIVTMAAVKPAYAQHSDLRNWNTFSFNYGLNKKLTFNFDQELRLQDNLTRINQLYTNIGATYKINKYVRIAGVYRFIARYKEDDSWGVRNRLYGDLIVKLRPGRFSYVYRARMQYEWRGAGYGKEYGRVPEIYWRNLLKASYKVNDIISPYLATEIRFQLQNPRIPYHNGFDRSRFTGGLDLQVNKNSTFGVYYLLQKEWNVNDPETLNVIGLEYTISID